MTVPQTYSKLLSLCNKVQATIHIHLLQYSTMFKKDDTHRRLSQKAHNSECNNVSNIKTCKPFLPAGERENQKSMEQHHHVV